MLDKTEFRRVFPRLFLVRALDFYEAIDQRLPTNKTWWIYMAAFEFVSKVWGSIVVPEGFTTDFASVPPFLRGLYDNDAPIMLFPSAAHDLLFLERADGTRGWLPDGRQLSLHEVNLVLVEAMEACGASLFDRMQVLAAVECANIPIKHTFRS